eukprot:CAMPEP_0171511060 /NCGR_PEP_ID=MMETSP0959-20130129/758_1 /TAXON_ID=87120 /ORGANISM="Aurantiochytrium limacinum, Strain ATCCMYA-1381" /LENGTH=89 /DNA_ID=CAMNT_0012048591 /DNA_START=225 /DNA_END=494 /DNA_ORIENTATION=-
MDWDNLRMPSAADCERFTARSLDLTMPSARSQRSSPLTLKEESKSCEIDALEDDNGLFERLYMGEERTLTGSSRTKERLSGLALAVVSA